MSRNLARSSLVTVNDGCELPVPIIFIRLLKNDFLYSLSCKITLKIGIIQICMTNLGVEVMRRCL